MLDVYAVILNVAQAYTVLEDIQLRVPISFTDVDVPRTQQRYRVELSTQHGTMQLQRYDRLQFFNISRDGYVDGKEQDWDQLIFDSKGSSLTAAALLGLATPDDVITPPSVALQDAVGQIEEVELEFSHDVVFVGELADCNVALASLFYRSDLNWNSANKDKDVLTVRVTEVLTAGTGVPTTDVRHLHVEVISVNDAPVVHVPGMEPLYGSWLRVVVWSLAGLGGSVCATGHGCVATVSC